MNPSSRRRMFTMVGFALCLFAAGRAGAEEHDVRYTADGLRQAFATLCKNLGYHALRVEIDQTESPYLVYGVLEGRCDYQDMRRELSSMRGYAYAGCVTAVRSEESVTVFALNMVPPQNRSEGDVQRVAERLKGLARSQR